MKGREATFQSKMILITAPSGAGKTTIVRHLLSVFDFLDFSVSATTRNQRTHEQDGIDYYFKSPQEFKSLIQEDAFAEYEEVYKDQFYGTLKSEVDRLWGLKKRIVFDIDVQGATNLKKLYKENALGIFIAPPSLQILKDRLRSRKTETEKQLETRLTRVRKELEYREAFDTVLVNDNLDTALKEAEHKVLSYIFPNAKLFQDGRDAR
jgi:guanylate kinase